MVKHALLPAALAAFLCVAGGGAAQDGRYDPLKREVDAFTGMLEQALELDRSGGLFGIGGERIDGMYLAGHGLVLEVRSNLANTRSRLNLANLNSSVMALRRGDMALRGVLRAVDLPQARDGRRVRVAGMVITRQRPGPAKGFVFLTLEDETGISNIIVRPDLFDRERMAVVRQPFLLVDGVLQHQDGVLSVRAERLQGIDGSASVDAHNFY